MRSKVHKWFWVWDFDKEEQWLNEMAAHGKGLVHVGFCTYEFEDCAPGAYFYRMELLENLPDTTESSTYIGFLEETGAEQVGNYLRWCYFRRKAELGPFDLFSDFDSRIRHLNRILWLLWVVLVLNLLLGAANIAMFSPVSVNTVLGIANLAVAAVLLLAVCRITSKKNRLRRERSITEN